MSLQTTDAHIEDRVLAALRRLDVEPDAIRLDATMEEVDLDSLDSVEFQQLIEDTFSIRISTESMAGLRTVADVVDLVAALTSR